MKGDSAGAQCGIWQRVRQFSLARVGMGTTAPALVLVGLSKQSQSVT